MKDTITQQIARIIQLAKEKNNYTTGIDDIVAISYALGAANVTTLLNDKGRVSIPAIAALINYDATNAVGLADTVFETLVDLDLTVWPDGYQSKKEKVTS